jgi:salicylate hydroxylase
MTAKHEDYSPCPPTAPIIIIGAGIGGLTLAAICRKVNLSCIVLERTEECTPAGAGISLAPNVLRVLEQLGLYQNIKSHGQALKKMLVHYNTTQWREMDFTGVENKFGYPVYSIERAQIHHILLEAAGGIEAVQWGRKVTDIIDDASASHVVVRTATGEEFRSDVVVGADGIRSVTRRVLARNAGMDSINSINFTGRVHMSGYTRPLPNLGKEHEGVGNWIFYDDAILTTWPCKDNRQWYIGVKVC